MTEKVIIDKLAYQSLLAASNILTLLNFAGVDQWEGYQNAVSLAQGFDDGDELIDTAVAEYILMNEELEKYREEEYDRSTDDGV